MGFLDKLLGSAASEVINKIKEAAAVTPAPSSAQTSRPSSSSVPSFSAAPTSGDSWGPEMPAEENQFNSGKAYDQYFYDIYVENFPQYRITCEKVRKGAATVITFYNGITQEKALVVELLSENSSAEALRYNARKEHVPYLRFYYNHAGWWNTKSYVIRRTKEALQ